MENFLRHPPGHLKPPATTTATTEPHPPHFYIPATFQTKKHLHLRIMKFALIAAASILSTLASSFALPGLFPRETIIRPSIAIAVRAGWPNTPYPSTNLAEASTGGRDGTTETLLGFVVPPCIGRCTISFSDADEATGSRALNLLPMSRYPLTGIPGITGLPSALLLEPFKFRLAVQARPLYCMILG